MRIRLRSPAAVVRLCTTAFVGLCGAHPVAAQIPASQVPQLAAPQSAAPAVATDESSPSLVFPDGFPSFPSETDAALPEVVANPEANQIYSAIQPTDSDYASNGYEPRDGQDAPGEPAFYLPVSDPLPAYYYQTSYYDTSGIGARPLADYSPSGYEEREFQDAPGAPEFTPITPPTPVSPEQRDSFVTRGLFPGSFLVPGTNTSFRIRGFVRLAGLYDFNPIGSRDDFVTNTIPVPQEVGQNFNMAARYSRFAIETWTPTNFKEWNVHTFIEGDFFNGAGQAVGGGGNPFRLRFAFVDFGYFRLGQQNTVFIADFRRPH